MTSSANRFQISSLMIVLLVGISWTISAGDKSTTKQPNADRIVMVKSDHTLILLNGSKILKTYKVALGRGGSAAKNQTGDRETPEGEYVIDAKNMHSRFHRSLHVSYPNARDRERARKLGVTPGGQIEIHGVEEKWAWLGSLHRTVDWTAGCIAVTNPEIEEIYKLVPIGTPIEIRATSTGAPMKRYWSMGGNTLSEADGSGNITAEYVYFGGKRIARIDMPANTVHYYLSDHLGSTSIVASAAGAIEEESDYYPFGTEVIVTGPGANELKFNGKRRDAESGLYNYGARYYGSVMDRFIQPDPLLNSGKPWDPQSWNRYSYVRNNPLTRIDPTGLYDLKNTCGASDGKCNKQFNQHAKDLKNGLKNLQDKLKSVKDPAQKARLGASLKALGTEGDHNGVNIAFGATKDGGAGETVGVSDPKTYKETYNVTLDPSKLSSQNDYAVVGAHEGTHVDDISNYLANPAGLSPLSDFSVEYRGYQTSAYAASALGESSISFNYDGRSSVIWNGSWGAVDKNITNFVTKFHDKGGKPNHTETQPHNPWPN